TQPLSMTTTGAPTERPGGEAHRVCTSRAAPLTSRRGGPHTTSTPRRRAAGLPGRAVRSPRGPPTRRAAPARRAPRRAGRAPSAGRAGAVGLAHDPTGRQLQDLHDPVAVQVGTDLRDLLLLGEVVDAGLELVVGAGEGAGLAPVAGG